ncbi:hypothetical protein [Pedobacter flavus]|uniref:Glycosyltransferase n=1 Tax=Pedobacter flavus TaxID=3113906 RepID=A0ABU7H109_9SPHI|nr:hypothetical protein [Pedobacter sp. VNH31]MEE1884708.1 hypothetical protein [Pedobacter sp. VNH31]
MKTIVIISLSQLHRDPRILRQIEFLKDSYNLVAVGLTNPNIKGVEYLEIPEKPQNNWIFKIIDLVLVLFQMFDFLYWKQINIKSLYGKLEKLSPADCIISNDVQVLPLAVKLSEIWGCKLITDLHEFAPLEKTDSLIWKIRFKNYYTSLLKKYLNKSDVILTVCNSIKERLKKDFNVEATVLTNAPYFQDLKPKPVLQDSIKIIHHGGAMRSRHLNLMIEMMDKLDSRFELNLMLMESDPGYLGELKLLSAGKKNIKFLEPVPTTEIAEFINQFDIGLFILPPVNFNYEIALPNKFFEFIQARLCIAIAPSVEMAAISKKYHLGVIANDFTAESMAVSLNKLSAEDIMHYKSNADKSAISLSANGNKTLLLCLTNKLLSDTCAE